MRTGDRIVNRSAIDWDALVDAATDARSNAYVPYSTFPVGAAILTGSGRIVVGCNVENASFGLCICAERVAVDTMVASGEREIRAIAVVTGAPSPTPPCGMCRQVLAEFAQDIPIHLASTVPGTMARTTSLAKLLPDAFRGDMLPSHEGGAS
ncbi:MAG TPA: cytidine deaminase [Polyangiaceae bacterium]|nr:cytidine deaminase [Polyangiaceae bacterium]